MENSSYQLLKNWLPRFIILVAIFMLTVSLYFIYQNVWQIFSSPSKDLLLQQEVVQTELNIGLFRKIEETINNKKNAVEANLDNLKNPFLLKTEVVEVPKFK
jgi:hypothetical protein